MSTIPTWRKYKCFRYPTKRAAPRTQRRPFARRPHNYIAKHTASSARVRAVCNAKGGLQTRERERAGWAGDTATRAPSPKHHHLRPHHRRKAKRVTAHAPFALKSHPRRARDTPPCAGRGESHATRLESALGLFARVQRRAPPAPSMHTHPHAAPLPKRLAPRPRSPPSPFALGSPASTALLVISPSRPPPPRQRARNGRDDQVEIRTSNLHAKPRLDNRGTAGSRADDVSSEGTCGGGDAVDLGEETVKGGKKGKVEGRKGEEGRKERKGGGYGNARAPAPAPHPPRETRTSCAKVPPRAENTNARARDPRRPQAVAHTSVRVSRRGIGRTRRSGVHSRRAVRARRARRSEGKGEGEVKRDGGKTRRWEKGERGSVGTAAAANTMHGHSTRRALVRRRMPIGSIGSGRGGENAEGGEGNTREVGGLDA
ncbi:hypothetical protein B0H16DRAFT_1758103 [Mycena metata]|uniref:Uncharacterized protein n=1 Tax=Mycena metata TaxID=1033252 RepID=A0AAD7IEV2_9AGAR|nr:hypothetical protein B0H16DRAFT_1758103 [Mycena metata]